MRLPKIILALGLMVGMGLAATSQASATDYGHRYQPAPQVHCNYKTVTIWVEKEIRYRKRIVRYHECGTPYYGWKWAYRTIKVPKTIRIKKCH